MMGNITMTIGEMISNSLTKNIFPSNYEFYADDEQAKKAFEEKFVNHYYYREIGFESPFIFRHKLESHLRLNMPYWKELYRTELEARNINFLLNKDLKETFIREIDTENETSGINITQQNSSSSNSINQNATSSTSNSSEQNGTSSNNHKESSLNDGVSMPSLTEGYLTGTSSDEGTQSTTVSSTSSDNSQSYGTSNTSDNVKTKGSVSQSGNEKMVEKTDLLSQGNIGITSSAQLLKEWREVLLNMDKIIIESCNDLFLKIY